MFGEAFSLISAYYALQCPAVREGGGGEAESKFFLQRSLPPLPHPPLRHHDAGQRRRRRRRRSPKGLANFSWGLQPPPPAAAAEAAASLWHARGEKEKGRVPKSVEGGGRFAKWFGGQRLKQTRGAVICRIPFRSILQLLVCALPAATKGKRRKGRKVSHHFCSLLLLPSWLFRHQNSPKQSGENCAYTSSPLPRAAAALGLPPLSLFPSFRARVDP